MSRIYERSAGRTGGVAAPLYEMSLAGTRRVRQAVRRSGRLRSLKPGTPQFTFVMGLVFLFAGLAELVGVVCGAPHSAAHWGWIAVAIWLAGGGVLIALATLQLHRTARVRVPL